MRCALPRGRAAPFQRARTHAVSRPSRLLSAMPVVTQRGEESSVMKAVEVGEGVPRKAWGALQVRGE